MEIVDILITVGVLFGFFIIVYSKVRNQGIGEIFADIKGIFQSKAEDIKDKAGELRYA